MAWSVEFVNSVLTLALAVAPWLLLGLVLAGLIRAFLPQSTVLRFIGGSGPGAITRAALIGLPLPLCSCGAIPAALQLHRRGAGRGPSTAFLVSTPGIGIDAIVLSTVMLGPAMAVARAAGAAALAVAAGLAVVMRVSPEATSSGTSSCSRDACCVSSDAMEPAAAEGAGGGLRGRLADGLHYAFTEMVDDIGVWMLLGLIAAAAAMTVVPPDSLAAYGSGIAAMIAVSLAGIPMYICATAATPIAAAMIAAGVSPGTAAVFLLAAPVTSLATLAVLRASFGWRYVAGYVAAIAGGSVLIGLIVDAAFGYLALTPAVASAGIPELVPQWASFAALVILLTLALRPLRRGLGRMVQGFGMLRPSG